MQNTRTASNPDVELIAPGKVRVKCRKCGERITLDFGNLTRSEAVEGLALQDFPRECPGFHTELSGWAYLWHFDEGLALVYGPT